MIKIVIITPYWLQTKGGITTVAYYLSEELKHNGYSVQVLTPDEGPGVVRIPKNRLFLTLNIIKILKDVKPDVIHVQAHGSLLLPPVVYKILFNKDVRIIFTFHTQPHTTFFLTGKSARERGAIRQIFFNYCPSSRKC